MFIILQQQTDTIKVEMDESAHNQEDVIGTETAEVRIPQESGPEVSNVLK